MSAVPTVGAFVLWGAFAGLVACAFVLYALPRRLSGPVTSDERRAGAGARVRVLVRRWITPGLAVGGLAVLLPPLAPPKVAFTSWLVHAEQRRPRGLECAVPPLLERATEHMRTSGVPAREALREALLAAPFPSNDLECPSAFVFPPGMRDADIESLELTVVMLAARSQSTRAISVEARTSTGALDPWELLARGMSTWAHVSIKARQPSFGTGVVRAVERAIVTSKGIELWIMTDRAYACDPTQPLQLELEGREACPLTWETPAACDSERTPPVLAIHARCSSLGSDASLGGARIEGLEVPLDSIEPTKIRVDGSGMRWTEARRIAEQNRAFVEELAASGLALPELGDGADVSLRVDDSGIVVQGARGCSTTSLATSPDEGGPFSWAETGIDDPISSAGPGRIRLHGGWDVLERSSDAYEPTIFGATMRSISWAADCLEHCTCDSRRPPPRGGESRPLLTQGEIDELVGRERRPRDAVGVLLIGLSLLMTSWWILSARRGSR